MKLIFSQISTGNWIIKMTLGRYVTSTAFIYMMGSASDAIYCASVQPSRTAIFLRHSNFIATAKRCLY